MFTDYAQGEKYKREGGGGDLQGGNKCTISSVISINEVDNEFQSIIALGK